MSISAEAIFCDDIRVEDNGKFILIGVYGSDLVPGRMPNQFPLSIFVRATGLPVGPSKFRLEMVMPGGKVTSVVEGEGFRDSNNTRPVIMVFPSLHCEIEKYGDLVCRLSIDGAEPEEIGRLPIVPPAVR